MFALLEDQADNSWVGTFGGRLDRMDRTTGVFTHFRHDDSDTNSLSNNLIASPYEHRAGN